MCGIAGFCNGDIDWKNKIMTMNQRMIHRGPDDEGIWRSEDGKIVFGHRRLSILDLSKCGKQPMISASQRYSLVFNGEIFNYVEIYDEIRKYRSNIKLRGRSDTEVLLEAIDCYGLRKTISMCNGMFAMAVYDTLEKKLYLIRDRMGEKPLFYGVINGQFTFASDLGCLAAIHNFNKKINKEVLTTYFCHGYIPAPFTIYEGIYKLTPGCILEIESPYVKYSVSQYWSVKAAAISGQSNLFSGSELEASIELERLLTAAISRQMLADVPVGAFLSAGIDSTTIVSLMQSLNKGKTKTFTIGFKNKGYDEAKEARHIASILGTDHTELYIGKRDVCNVIPQIANIYSEPFADSSQIPTYIVSALAKKDVTVSLSGDGGDELFCGYKDYDYVRRTWMSNQRLPYYIQKLRGHALTHRFSVDNETRYKKGEILEACNPEELYIKSLESEIARRIVIDHRNCVYDSSYGAPNCLFDVEHRIMLMDMMMYHPDDILTKVDRAAMANSLETRIPFLDKDIIEFAWTLPLSYKKSGQTTKKVLRNILYKYLPKELMEKKKSGFSLPLFEMLREEEMKKWAEELIDPDRIQRQGILNAEIVNRIWSDYINKGIWREQLWYILIFQQWGLENRIL